MKIKNILLAFVLAALAGTTFAAPNPALRVFGDLKENTKWLEGEFTRLGAIKSDGNVVVAGIAHVACLYPNVRILPPELRPQHTCAPSFIAANQATFKGRAEIPGPEFVAAANQGLYLANATPVAAPEAVARAASAPVPATTAELEALRQEQAALAAARDADRRTIEALNAEVAKVEERRLGSATAATKAAVAAARAEVQKFESRVQAAEKAASAAQGEVAGVTSRLTDVEQLTSDQGKTLNALKETIADLAPKNWLWWLIAAIAATLLLAVFLLGRFGGFKREIDQQGKRIGEVVSTVNTAAQTASTAQSTAATAAASASAAETVAKTATTTADKAIEQAGEAKAEAGKATTTAAAADAKATEALARQTVVEWSSGSGLALKGKTDALGEGDCLTEIITLSDGRQAELKICGADKDNLVIHGIAGTRTCLRANVVKTIFAGTNVLKDGKGAIVADTRFEQFIEV